MLCLLAGCGSEEPRAASGPQLYLAGDGELWVVDAATGRVRHERRADFGPGDPPHRVLARDGGVVMGMPFGAGAFYIPSARRDRVWVVDIRRSDASVRAVREVTVDGETTVAAASIPTPHWPLAAVRDGLLIEAGAHGVNVWDPVTQRTVHQLRVRPDQVGPSADDTVAACDNSCRVLRLIDVRTGAERTVHAPAGQRIEPWTGAFSPDGDVLAVTVHDTIAPAIGQRRLALIEVASGRIGVVPGSGVPPGYTMVAWSASGAHVFLAGGKRFEPRVIVGYRLGTRAARELDIDVGDFYDLAAT